MNVGTDSLMSLQADESLDEHSPPESEDTAMDSIASRPSALRTMFGHLAWMQVMIGIACLVGVFTSLRVATIVAVSLILLVSAGLAVRRAAFKMNVIFDEELDHRSN